MAKKDDTKKEVVEEKKKTVTVELDKDKLERTRTFSKILYILARIAKVFMVLGVIGMALLMAITPVVVKNFKVEGNTISVFGQNVTYKEKDDKFNLYFGDVEIGSLTSEEKVSFDYVLKELENTNIAKAFGFLEFALVCETAVLVILYFVFKYLDKLFVNICNSDTPFTNDNLEYLKKLQNLFSLR